MNKLIIFDLDGVLIDSREMHYHAFNQALRQVGEQYVISREDNQQFFDGKNTLAKLSLLTETRGLPKQYHDQIWKSKQAITFESLKKVPRDEKLIHICQRLKSMNYQIAVATNSIRESAKLVLLGTGIMEYVDYYQSFQDVQRAKPFPEIYWRCMTALNVLPKNTIIIEDSDEGCLGALNSGAYLIRVKDTKDVTWKRISDKIHEIEN